MDDKYTIKTTAELEDVLGEPAEALRVKIVSQLDEMMKKFIRQSPLIFLSTIDENGHVDVSPKGDPDGFVGIDESGHLLIPERPGNRLTLGFRNILRNAEVGLIFLVPNQKETLRVKGVATLHKDPEVLEKMTVNGKPALLYTRVKVKECFFHCGKALVRSKLWQPEFWGDMSESIGARQFSSLWNESSEEAYEKTKADLDIAYKEGLY